MNVLNWSRQAKWGRIRKKAEDWGRQGSQALITLDAALPTTLAAPQCLQCAGDYFRSQFPWISHYLLIHTTPTLNDWPQRLFRLIF